MKCKYGEYQHRCNDSYITDDLLLCKGGYYQFRGCTTEWSEWSMATNTHGEFMVLNDKKLTRNSSLAR